MVFDRADLSAVSPAAVAVPPPAAADACQYQRPRGSPKWSEPAAYCTRGPTAITQQLPRDVWEHVVSFLLLDQPTLEALLSLPHGLLDIEMLTCCGQLGPEGAECLAALLSGGNFSHLRRLVRKSRARRMMMTFS